MPRPRKHPVTNRPLAVLLERTGWSMETTARKINQVAGENGQCLRYGASSVCHWLTGVRPNAAAVPAIVETFARELNQPDLTVEDLGWPGVVAAQVDPWAGDPVECLFRLGRADMLSPGESPSSDLDRTSYSAPQRFPWCQGSAEPGHLTRRSGLPDVTRLREGTGVLLDTYQAFGGGYARALGGCFLVNNTLPLLRDATGAAGRELMSATSEVSCLLGSMSGDAGATGRAQRYYVLALRLAAEAADPVALAIGYSRLAARAVLSGRPHAAWGLLNAAENNNQPFRYGISLGRAAVHACLNRAREARSALRAAERELSLAESPSQPHWFVSLTPGMFEHRTGLVLMALGDLEGAGSHLAEALRSYRPDQRLNRALAGLHLARAHVSAGDADTAADWLQVVAGDMGAVVSGQLAAEIAALCDRWPHADRLLPPVLTTTPSQRLREIITTSSPTAAWIRERGATPLKAVASS